LFIWMIVSPTPGSSGIAEGGFQLLFSDFTPLGLGLALATLWRLITYYPYLFIGIPILPRWLARVYKKKGEKPQQTPSPVH
ncbi:MAG: lysylphosphatidylglycerol synthase domain-containing protein, partial [Bacteroidota bacterium]